jgi:predicted PurR-regulated permease PerM
LAQVAPSWVVDSAIYSEMKGGLHPWFTGLAVVGGVYVFGPVGAVYGPLALCLVYVLVNMYSTFMQAGWGQSVLSQKTFLHSDFKNLSVLS